eukprot:8659924-Alexandrium_andersonii.AAC.1
MVLTLYLTSKLAANHVCILMHFAAAAGVGGYAQTLSMPPGRPSGRYKRHLDAALGFKSSARFYTLPMPGQSKHALGRLTHQVLVQPPHE